MTRNIKLEIEYDGTDFCGWQVQPELRTVQGEIQQKLKATLKHEVNLVASGRTDVGVHALGQVANFKTESQLEAASIMRGLNGLLPDDVVIKNVHEVDLDFNARYRARTRIYKYRVHLDRTAILRNYVWQVLYPLNRKSILDATGQILGEKDFSSFCVAESVKENNRCKVMSAAWEESKNELVLRIEANRFLHAMVRTLVGTLIQVGRGYFSVSDFASIMKAKDRRKAGPTAPACGLYLAEVRY